jgi:hypothetical protein
MAPQSYNQHTKCIAPSGYSGSRGGPKGALDIILTFLAAFAAAIVSPLFGLAILIVAVIRYCSWWLYGRLVCLGGDKCIIGLALEATAPQDKTGGFFDFDVLDTDYTVNLLLAPDRLHPNKLPTGNKVQGYLLDNQSSANPEFAKMLSDHSDLGFRGEFETGDPLVSHAGESVLSVAQASALGFQLTPPDWQPNHPYSPGDRVSPHDVNADDPRLIQLCTAGGLALSGAVEPAWGTAPGDKVNDGGLQWTCQGRVPAVQILEVEFEGSGVWDFYQAALAALSVSTFGAFGCWIPVIGWFVCLVLALIALGILLSGYLNGRSDRSAFFQALDQVGSIEEGKDVLFVMGTWIYDTAHEGWNELHPVKFCQKIATVAKADLVAGEPFRSLDSLSEANLQKTIDGFCGLAQDALQDTTIKSQAQPENTWTLHPLVDGCAPSAPPIR